MSRARAADPLSPARFEISRRIDVTDFQSHTISWDRMPRITRPRDFERKN